MHFISHMVQMKENVYKKTKNAFSHLYIPHGSDESYNFTHKEPPVSCFISHMVQMKVALEFLLIGLLSLFISHMVQMKD